MALRQCTNEDIPHIQYAAYMNWLKRCTLANAALQATDGTSDISDVMQSDPSLIADLQLEDWLAAKEQLGIE